MDAIRALPKYVPELTPQDLTRYPASGNRKMWDTRVMWTSTALVKKGEIDKSTRGVWAITASGMSRLLGETSVSGNLGGGLVSAVVSFDNKPKSVGSHLVRSEDELYGPLREWLDKNWGEETRDENNEYWVKVTASQSRRGKWSRPDLTSVDVSRFEILPRKDIEVSTFEVKRESDALNLSSIYEAASHQRWGHNAYLVIERPQKVSSNVKSDYDANYLAELARFGVGLLAMSWNPAEKEYDIEVVSNPVRKEPDPKELDKMLGDFFLGDQREVRRFKDLVR